MKALLIFAALAGSVVYPQVTAAQEAEGGSPGVVITPLDVTPLTGLAQQLRALQLVQDRLVAGNGKAVDAQRALLEQIMTSLETRDGVAGLTEKEAATLLPMALLNGADPERVRAVLGQSGVTTKDAFLVGALAYSEGRIPNAITAFETVDAVKLAPLARAQFYLTYGAIQSKSAPENAIKNFIKARLDAPGTLIEEAALRRQAMLEISTPETFLKLVRAYLHRFAASPFASAFISQFAFSIADLGVEVQERLTAELDALLEPAQTQDRQNFYAILSRSSLIGGNTKMTDFATLRAVRDVTDPSQLLSVRLYRAAFEIAGTNHTQAATELHSLMRVPLQASDREILTAAISVAQELRRWPYDEEDNRSGVALEVETARVSRSAKNEPSSAILSAQKLLGETNNFLELSQ